MTEVAYGASLFFIVLNVLWAVIMIPVNFYRLCRGSNVARWLADSAYEKLFRILVHVFTILLCTTLYVHLERTEISAVLTFLTLFVYSSIEHYAVRYFMTIPKPNDPII